MVDNAWMKCGLGAEVIARLVEKQPGMDIDIRRLGFAFVPCPTTPSLERHFYPNAKSIALQAHRMIRGDKITWTPKTELTIEEVEFKGPF